jgi:hypothetical protein
MSKKSNILVTVPVCRESGTHDEFRQDFLPFDIKQRHTTVQNSIASVRTYAATKNAHPRVRLRRLPRSRFLRTGNPMAPPDRNPLDFNIKLPSVGNNSASSRQEDADVIRNRVLKVLDEVDRGNCQL